MDKILAWILELRIPILCFQEVFTETARQTIKQRLERHGYTVVLPQDGGVSFFPSGLITAILNSEYTVLHSIFESFLDYHNVEIFANKGFHRITLQDQASNKFHIINTHTQSDEEVLWWTPYSYKKAIRYRQAEQMIQSCKEFRDPVIVIGDFNQESSLHPHLRTLPPPSSFPMKKSTFFRTGEDLDHVAWMPLQWVGEGCGFCGTFGPFLDYCKVHSVPWSDHAPVEIKMRYPLDWKVRKPLPK